MGDMTSMTNVCRGGKPFSLRYESTDRTGLADVYLGLEIYRLTGGSPTHRLFANHQRLYIWIIGSWAINVLDRYHFVLQPRPEQSKELGNLGHSGR